MADAFEAGKNSNRVQLQVKTANGGLKKFIEDEIKKIDGDERYHYKPATIFANAPLALIQATMETRMQLLEEIKSRLPV